MLREVKFENFRILRDAVLPLGPLTVLVGANSSGKSTAIRGLKLIATAAARGKASFEPADASLAGGGRAGQPIRVTGHFAAPWESIEVRAASDASATRHWVVTGGTGGEQERAGVMKFLAGLCDFAFDASVLRLAHPLTPNVQLGPKGEWFPVVLDTLRDSDPERFEELNDAVADWFDEFDKILFETTSQGNRTFALRRASDKAIVPAVQLSEGTLLAFAILTLSMLRSPPTIACFEEPERGIHPRLLRRVFDALVRLSHPESAGDARPPTQVIVTTHSPYFLDLFRDMPEVVVVAERKGDEAKFERICDRKDLEEILQGGPLGDIWYSGVLGGVPSKG